MIPNENFIMKLFFLSVIFSCSAIVKGQDVSHISNEAMQLEVSMNDEQALIKYKAALSIQPANIFLLCKCSELSTRIGNRLVHEELKQTYLFNSAKSYAKEAISLDSTNSEANFVMCLARGSDAQHSGSQDRIEAVKDIKKYADLSIHYDHNNYKAWYVLGKWYFEINSLNYFQRTAVKIFFGAFPSSSIEDAIHCFERAKTINPGFVLNYLSLAKAYKQKDENEAKQSLITMLSLPDRTQDDESIKNEGRALLKKWD
jgi:tetratricopeptide (TPR) repeat protein